MTYLDKVKKYYDERGQSEWSRLDRYPVEFEMTKRIFDKWMPKPCTKVCDIGGGPGRYSFYLANKGYDVTLLDLSDECIKSAQKRIKFEKTTNLAAFHANAMDLSLFSDNSFDCVLLMGPLYHLINQHERNTALSEAYRILKKEGVIFASFVSKYERIRFLSKHDPSYIIKHRRQITSLLENGISSDCMELSNGTKSFTIAYLIEPMEIRAMMEPYNFNTMAIHGLETIITNTHDIINQANIKVKKSWLDLNFLMSTKEALFGNSDHFLYVGQK